MILYKFKCSECNHEFDLMTMVEDRNIPTLCPECNAKSYRVFTPPTLGRIHGYNAKNGYTEKPDWHPKSKKYRPDRIRTDEERRKGI